MVAETEIRAACRADFEAATRLLQAAGLPVGDLSADLFDNYLVAWIGGRLVGCIGLEAYAPVGLLRSLVVDGECRDAGIGGRLVAELEARAAANGIAELWLLTIDADRYFAGLGYRARERAEAPGAVRRSAEFSTLCPADAVLMSKAI